MEDVVLKYVVEIVDCCYDLLRLPTLEPSEEVNRAFKRLVSICSLVLDESLTNAILTHPEIVRIKPTLQKLCSMGECALEQYWAKEIIAVPSSHDGGTSAKDMLSAFPYHSNYRCLTRMELSAINLCACYPPKKFAFLGCGPLPLTSLCIVEQFGGLPLLSSSLTAQAILVHNIDQSAHASTTARILCQKLNVPCSTMSFAVDDATNLKESLRGFDVVYVAALVGSTTTEKRKIFSTVMKKMRPGALLVVRSATGMRSLLYPVVKVTSDFDLDIFEPLMEIHPYNHIINSVIIGRISDFKPTANGKVAKHGEAVTDRELSVNIDENTNEDGKMDGNSIGEAMKSSMKVETESDKARRVVTRQR